MECNTVNKCFCTVTVFLLANKEQKILEKTFYDVVSAVNREELEKIVFVLKDGNCPSYYTAEKICKKETTVRTEIYIQQSGCLEDVYGELPSLAEGSHFIIMASDYEMNPFQISRFISYAKENPTAVISAAKWMKESTVVGYNAFHSLLTKILNRIVCAVLGVNVHDILTTYRIVPKNIYDDLDCSIVNGSVFVFALFPLVFGKQFIEIPTEYRKRSEGESNFNFLYLVRAAYGFIRTAVKLKHRKILLTDYNGSNR